MNKTKTVAKNPNNIVLPTETLDEPFSLAATVGPEDGVEPVVDPGDVTTARVVSGLGPLPEPLSEPLLEPLSEP